MFEWIKRFLTVVFWGFFTTAVEFDVKRRRKMLKRLCAAVDSENWDTADKISYSLYRKPYDRPKVRK